QSPGPVNMEIARRTAAEVAKVDLDTGQVAPEPAVAPEAIAAFGDVARAAQLSVSEATGIAAVLTVPIRTVDRSAWASTTLDGLTPVLRALAAAPRRAPEPDTETPAASPDALFGMVMQTLVPLLLGGWAGSMIG